MMTNPRDAFRGQSTLYHSMDWVWFRISVL